MDQSVFEEVISRTTPSQCFWGACSRGPGSQVHGCEQRVGWILARQLTLLCFWRTLPFQGWNYAQLPLRGKAGVKGAVGSGWLFGWGSPRLPGPDCLEHSLPGTPTSWSSQLTVQGASGHGLGPRVFSPTLNIPNYKLYCNPASPDDPAPLAAFLRGSSFRHTLPLPSLEMGQGPPGSPGCLQTILPQL